MNRTRRTAHAFILIGGICGWPGYDAIAQVQYIDRTTDWPRPGCPPRCAPTQGLPTLGTAPRPRPASGSLSQQSAAVPTSSFSAIQFAFNSTRPTPRSIEILRNLGNALNHELADQESFLIEGHTDVTGDRNYNLNLSRRRAEAVKDYLVHKAGVSPSRLKTAGKGASEPINAADPYAADNRRVVVINTAE